MAKGGFDFKYLILGECKDEKILDRIENSILKEKTIITGYLTDEEFDNYFICADIIPVMRYPSAGESSGVAYRALGFGKVLIVPEYMAFSNVDDNLCDKVYYQESNIVNQIYEIIKKYAKDRKLLKETKDQIFKSTPKKYGLDKIRKMYEEVFSLEFDS